MDTLGTRLSNLFRQPGRRDPFESKDFWALRDISFQVTPGESVGVIGHNGAGKSTLLKILSRITTPSEGCVRYSGRVGSLLEVGAGFHPELSGRDNIFLSGAVLGMRHRQIDEKLDEIIAFSEIGPFIDTPVKRYSSGMYLRLAFAVAAHLDTDILLMDEVLAVGDAAFQKKCLDRMNGVARQGRTVLFVSHNLTAVRGLCNRAILLEKGRVAKDGPVNQVIEHYTRNALGASAAGRLRTWSLSEASGAPVQMLRAQVRPIEGDVYDTIYTDKSFVVEWEFINNSGHGFVSSSMTFHDERGLLLFDQGSWDSPKPLSPGPHRSRCVIPGNLLNDGVYFISLHFQCKGEQVLDLPNVLQIDLQDSTAGRHGWYGKWNGILRMRFDWQTVPIEPPVPEEDEGAR
jgi:lipopolysaccharide transport system ATP-binding protein